MPELPDVEVFRRYFSETSLYQKIDSINADASVLEEVSEKELKKALQGHKFSSAQRHGKYMFAGLRAISLQLAIHFGMTGFLKYLEPGNKKPPHTRMLVSFSNGCGLAFDCRRKLGRIRLIQDIREFIREKDLGPDALDPGLDQKEFQKRLAQSRGYIKSVLLNQSIIAGIGNIYSDEILFQARIHPKCKTGDLSESELDAVYDAMQRVLSSAIEAGADPEKMPSDFLIPNRDPKASCPVCGRKIEKISVSGRKGYLCPGCQG
ncbi:MAG: Fpg/Nei family DNA glycosylase [Desulfosalsimonas sp.]